MAGPNPPWRLSFRAALLGHLNIQTTRGCVAVFDEDIVRHHVAFLDQHACIRCPMLHINPRCFLRAKRDDTQRRAARPHC